jgi:hypothetical protein
MASEIVYDEVQFAYPGQLSVWVPVAKAFEWADAQEELWSTNMVRWHYEGETEQHESFAKSWWFGVGGKMARIGSGAYGNGLVIEREDPDKVEEIKVGDRVRSFDFADGEYGRSLIGERACFVEGTVISVGMVMEGCPRYEILVDFDFFGGEEHKARRVGTQVYPPVNGTPSTMRGPTDFVEKIDAPDWEASAHALFDRDDDAVARYEAAIRWNNSDA